MVIPSPDKEAHQYTAENGAIALAQRLDDSDEPVYIYDTQGRCQWVNPSGEKLLRQDASQIIGRYIFELFPGQIRFQIMAWRRVITSKAPSSFLSEVSVNGETRVYQTSLFPVMDNSGRVQSVVSVSRRFAEREALEYENQMQEAELALIQEIASIMTSSLDLSQVYEHFASEFNKLVAFDRIAILLQDDEKQELRLAFAWGPLKCKACQMGSVAATDPALLWLRAQRKAHISRDLAQQMEFPLDSDLLDEGVRSVMRIPLITRKGVVGMLLLCSIHAGVYGDREQAIAERMVAQIAPAIENAQLYQQAQERAKELEVIDEIASIMTSSLRIQEVYERFASEVRRLFSFDRMSIVLVDEKSQKAVKAYTSGVDSEALRTAQHWPMDGADMRRLLEERQTIMESDLSRRPRSQEDEALLKAGLVSEIRVPLISKDKVLGIFLLWSSQRGAFGKREKRILERLAAQIAPAIVNARLYEEVEQALERLRSTQEQLVRVERLRAMGELASGVAHDFNNSLAAILGRTQLLMNHITYEPHLRSLQLIEQAAHDSAQVVRRILDFARFRTESKFSPVNVNALVNDVVELTRHKWYDEAHIKGQRIDVSTHLDEVPSVLGNYSDLREVLTNLVINAYQAIPKDGSIQVSTRQMGDQVCIEVADTGVGMSPEMKKRVFEPFFTSKGAAGTGLGLSIAYGIISRHHGKIEIESEEGVGTAVRVLLPVAEGVAVVEESQVRSLPQSQRKARILVIEDEPLIRETLADMLAMAGHQVTLASDGEGGLAQFKQGRFDIIFTDLGMPGTSGWEVARAIKQQQPSVPVVMVTGWGVGIDREELERNKVDQVLPKPFDIDQVLNLVRDLVDGKGM